MPGHLRDSEKTAIRTFIQEAEALLLGAADVAPHDHHTLLDQVIKAELRMMTTILTQELEKPDCETSFKNTFNRCCKIRAQNLANSALEICVMPNSTTNELFAKIAILLFKPKTIGELLEILLPDAICISCEQFIEVPATKLPSLRLLKNPLNSLTQPPKLDDLANYILVNNLLLDTQDIANFNFTLHQTYYQTLNQAYPALASQLYQKNPALRALKNDLLMLESAGPTPRQAISALIKELKLGGQSTTGQLDANLTAQTAFTDFLEYVESLPETIKAQLLALSAAGKTIASVIAHLNKENCVEIAASQLQIILDNKEHSAFLNTLHTLTPNAILRLKNKYGPTKILTTADNDGIKPMPAMSHFILHKIQINDGHSFISILLSFSPDFYLTLLQKIMLMNAQGWIYGVLNLINGILNQEQYLAFINALVMTSDRFGGTDLLINYAMKKKNLILFEKLIQSSPDNQLITLMKTDQYGYTLLHRAVPLYPELSKSILELLPETSRLILVSKINNNANTALHLAVNKPESFRAILELLPKYHRLAALQVKDKKGYTVLHLAANQPESFRAILELLPQASFFAGMQITGERFRWFIASQIVSNNNDMTPHHIANNPESLKAYLNKVYPARERLAAILVTNPKNEMLLRLEVNHPKSLEAILDSLPEEDRPAAILLSEVLDLAVKHPISLKTILRLLPQTSRHLVIKASILVSNVPRETLLHLAVYNPASLQLILESLPIKDRLPAIETTNKNGDTVLELAIYNPASFQVILESLPIKDRLPVFETTNRNGDTLFERAVDNPEFLKAILGLLPVDDRFKAILKFDHENNTPFHCAADIPESLKVILELLPVDDRLSALETANEDGLTILDLAVDNPASLQVILESLPIKDRLPAIETANEHGDTVLEVAAENLESLKVILSLLPKEARSALIETEELSLFAALSPEELITHHPKNTTNLALRTLIEERLVTLLIRHEEHSLNTWQCLLSIILPTENNAHYDASTGAIRIQNPSEAPITVSLAHLLLDSYLKEGQTDDHKQVIKILLQEHKRKSFPAEEWLALAVIASAEGKDEEEKSSIHRFIASGHSSHSLQFFDTSRTCSISEAILQEFLSKNPEAETFYQHHQAKIHNILNLPRPEKLQKQNTELYFS